MNPKKIAAWDERDYRLWSDIMGLPSYGLIHNNMDNPMLSRRDVINLLYAAAEKLGKSRC